MPGRRPTSTACGSRSWSQSASSPPGPWRCGCFSDTPRATRRRLSVGGVRQDRSLGRAFPHADPPAVGAGAVCPMSDSFVHLHVHTEYSMLDGAARLKDLFREAARMQMPALAMTDHGNVFAAYDFWKQATDAGVKPLIGAEMYVTPGTHRSDRTRVRWADGGEDDVSGGGAFTHMTVLAENTAGMHNLFRLSSRASLEGYFYKPRVDRELLEQHSAGLIATTGCPSGEIQTRLRMGDYEGARRTAGELQEIFGVDSFF